MGIAIMIGGGLVALFIYAIIDSFLDERKTHQLIVQLGMRKDNESAIAFANHIAKAAIPNRPQVYNQLRAAWGIVRDARTISP